MKGKALKVKVGHETIEAYPVDDYVYEVSYCGRREFYQNAYDAFNSVLYEKDSKYEAKVTKIHVNPISENELEYKLLCMRIDSSYFRVYPKKIEQLRQSKFYSQRVWIKQNEFALFTILWVLFVVALLAVEIFLKAK